MRGSDGVDDCGVADADVDVVEDLGGQWIADDIDSEIDFAGDVERDHSQAVQAQLFDDRRSDAAAGSGDKGGALAHGYSFPLGFTNARTRSQQS